MLSEKIKEATKNNHQLLEKKLVAKMRLIANEQDYAQLLSLFYSFFGGLEIVINACFDRSLLPDYPLRRKTSALANDLSQLNSTLPAFANGDDLPIISNHLQALGALYVIEGSTLGGRIISKMIGQQLNLQGNRALSFFSGYGDETEKMWQVFKQTLDYPLQVDEENMVIQTANDTFLKFSHWFDGNY